MLTNEIVDASTDSFLIDNQGAGEVLVITFGFYDAAGYPAFEFFGRLKKLEELSGKKINKLLLRDKSNSWYHYGIAGLGADVAGTVAAISKIIAEVKPSKTIAVGQSMGGYAALMYGALLGVDKVISFGPLSCFDSKKLEILRDYRWLEIVKKVESSKPEIFYNDLPKLLREKGSRTDFEIIYGVNPGAMADRNEAMNYDAAHALQFYEIDNVKLSPVPNSPHAVVEYFRKNHLLDDLLLNRIFDTKPSVKANPSISIEWTKWLQENIELGCSEKQLVDALITNNFSAESATEVVATAYAQIELKKIC